MRADSIRLRQLIEELAPTRAAAPRPAAAPRAPFIPPGATVESTAGGDLAILSQAALQLAGIERQAGESPAPSARPAGATHGRLDVRA